MAQIIQSNLIFGLAIHPDSNVFTIFLYAMQIASVTILLYFILRSALFDSSFLPASAINCILDSPCVVLHVLFSFCKTSGPTTKATDSKVPL